MDDELDMAQRAVLAAGGVEAGEGEVVVRRADGTVLLRRQRTPLEVAMDLHGPVQQPPDWAVHPACARPPDHSGVCTLRFADGLYWCFNCEVAWTP
ncbi:MAG: hypothetical protein J2P45_27555 [Candidatus Dormibacteraeota bacterium]|nr:hypothetical protein [Candidatus Dormibacteraeota bacterium]